MVLVKTGDDGITVVSDVSAEFSLGGVKPFLDDLLGVGAGTQMVADVEVAIAEQFPVQSALHPLPVVAEGAEDHHFVMFPQIVINGKLPFSLQGKAVWVDQLNDIETSQTG